MDRRKELKEQYKLRKPPMGIYAIYKQDGNKWHIESSSDTHGALNGAKFKLEHNSYPNRELQSEWTKCKGEGFVIEVIEVLEYDKEDIKTDYTKELQLLKEIWLEKKQKENIQIYKR